MKRLLLLLACCLTIAAYGKEFSFVAVGDTAYKGEPSVEAYHQLIDLINQEDPVFTVHVGDIWGASVCIEERYEEILDTFNLYDHPLIFTPGDNEWTDCNRHAYGDWDPASRLQLIRDVYFKDDQSLGKQSITFIRQADISDYTKFVENVRWLHEEVLFVTLNITGSNNNVHINNIANLIEANERDQANVAWLRDSFRVAMEQEFKAVVLVFHAELFAGSGGQEVPPAYRNIVNEMKFAANLFGLPVLLVHGDQHRFTIDRPFSFFAGDSLGGANTVRLQVYGDPEVRAVKVNVDTESPWVFGFQPLYLQ